MGVTDRALEWQSFTVSPCLHRGAVTIRFNELQETYPGEQRVAYVIRFTRPYCVSYQNGRSPVCYIGSGRIERMREHQVAWLSKLCLILQEFRGYDIRVARPRMTGPNGFTYYQQVEADLLSDFYDDFGELPLFNRRRGKPRSEYDYEHSANLFSCGPGPGYNSVIEVPAQLRAC